MELIYLYIGDVDRPISNIGINFSSNFAIQYDPKNHKLQINKKEINDEKKINETVLYGSNISNLKLLVGRNGTGKSTILEILGLPKGDRNIRFGPYKDTGFLDLQDSPDKRTWFAIYHVKDDVYAAEGYWSDMLDFLSSCGFYLQNQYSVVFYFDEITQSARNIQCMQEYGDYKINDHLFYVLYQVPTGISWLTEDVCSVDDTGIGFLFERQHASHSGFGAVTKYLYDSIHQDKFSEKLEMVPGAEITIEINRTETESLSTLLTENSLERMEDGKKILSDFVYGENGKIYEPIDPDIAKMFHQDEETLSRKQGMVIMYLEEIVGYHINEQQKNGNIRGHYELDDGSDEYNQRKTYLLNRLMEFRGSDDLDYIIASKLVSAIENIPDQYFIDNRKARVSIEKMDENFLKDYMQILDDNQVLQHEINHRYYLKTRFRGLSSGEAHFLDLYASLYDAIQGNNHTKGDDCILLLDEPDARFHPEWSRNFIENISELLNSETFKNYQYQVIITTHSPLMLSDVPKKDIILLGYENGQTKTYKPKYGFMSGINDILVDSFFTQSIFGSFSRKYVKEILAKLEEYENEINNDKRGMEQNEKEKYISQINTIKEKILIVDDEIIYSSLMKRIRKLEEYINWEI